MTNEVNRPPLLSICIPTYCRAAYLREVLESVIKALKGFEKEVEVIVSDNASTDHTDEVLAEFQTRSPHFRASRNSVNIGGEMNFFHVAHLAKGKYIWILGDDDKVDLTLIATLFEKFLSDCDLVIMNNSLHSKDFKILHKQAMYSVSAPEVYRGREVILSNFGPMLSFISCVAVKRELFVMVSEEKFSYYAPFGLSFLYSIYASLPKAATTAFIRQPLLLCRGDNSIIPDYERVFARGMALVFDDLEKLGYSRQGITQAKMKVIRMYLLQHLVRCKLDDTFSWEMLGRFHQDYWHCMHVYVRLLIYALTPGSVVRFAKSLQKMVKAPSK